ncbi:unnamed protein product [Rotaria sp. Silwood2]|nr:unnamed protein product [Rotaria sp. Silwood2]CAF2666505.1 unnamed protein product [Rotaria sp. Silwood2]CAF3079355.1 unnamed protein product [Rotaria sp. Silwood2]CAF4145955.1 unnamed protein product [Rotaria sp. Silwood2]CAF4159316.1 unnamed protein product [Rotaria sp. Silwood2]
MFAEKPLFPNTNPSKIHLPPINKSHQRRLRPPPTPCTPLTAARAAQIAENTSALKAKYTDYITWLKTSSQNNREPVLTQELLKHSLCQMGIDSTQAEQLVSKCSWYVYQFQKNLEIDPEQKHQIIEIENKKPKQYKNKSRKITTIKDTAEDSTTTLTSFGTDDSCSFNSLTRMNNKHSVLPAINAPNLSTSSRFRRVDFGNEQVKNPVSSPPLSRWQSTLMKTRTPPKLQPLLAESNNNNTKPPTDLDASPQQSLRRHGFVTGHLRSILRKQVSSSQSVTSTEVSMRKMRSQLLTPSSTVLDDIPLGTRSQRLFGGSECFAQIMNELEQQKKTI